MATCPSCRARYPDDVELCESDGERLLPDLAFSGADQELSVGTEVGEYRVEKKIGEGGFGQVYSARHPVIGKTAAVKVLARQYSSNPEMVARFIDEARVVNQIRHRNIVDIFAFGTLPDGRQYFVMELLEGIPLEDYMVAEGALSIEVTLRILRQLGRALDAAHAAGVAHRDLKPENVFLTFDEDGGCDPKLLDFGIAKLLDSNARTSQKTRTGTPMGTPLYMSPEQCRGQNVDHRTDIYSFGVMVYQMLTGRPPFDGENMMDLMLKHTAAPAAPPSSVNPDVPPGLDAAVLAMLEKEPGSRPPSFAVAIESMVEAAARAGIQVSFGGGAPLPIPRSAESSKGSTVANRRELAEAHTVAITPEVGKTFHGSEADVAPRPTRRAAYLVAGAALAIGVGSALLVMKGEPDSSAAAASSRSNDPPPMRANRPKSAATPTLSATPPASGAPSAAPAVEAAKSVEISIETTPDGATVFRGDVELGPAGEPLQLDLSDDPVELLLKKPGYLPKSLTVVPDQPRSFELVLSPVPAAVAPTATAPERTAPTATAGNSDLEF